MHTSNCHLHSNRKGTGGQKRFMVSSNAAASKRAKQHLAKKYIIELVALSIIELSLAESINQLVENFLNCVQPNLKHLWTYGSSKILLQLLSSDVALYLLPFVFVFSILCLRLCFY